ncbi:MAG: phosphoglycerate mutase family protein [Chlamydiota bacterium]
MSKTFYIFFLLILSGNLIALDDPKVAIMRHGEGEHNLLHIYSTWTKEEGGIDHSLTEAGKQQVTATAQKLLSQGFNKETVGLVLVSPLQRTRETAQILIDNGVCSENMLMIEDLIREPRAENWEGKPSPPKLLNDTRSDEVRWQATIDASALHGGETTESIRLRIEEIIHRLSQWDASRGHVILISHGYTAQVFLKTYGEEKVTLNTAEARILSFPNLKQEN